jgi:coproporphyrinogen III oxidase-like Fe-S oxidoreductase
LGVQSLNDEILKTLGRNTDTKTTNKALVLIQRYWKGTFNADLINSVPGQSVSSALNDINEINKFEPDHISLYNLTFEKSTKLYSQLETGLIHTIPEPIEELMQKESILLLQNLGYKRYEISNYAKPGKQSLHNINYWEMGSYIGIGPSAASTLLTGNGPVRMIYKASTLEFLKTQNRSKGIEIELLSPESFLLEHLMMGFRLLKGISISHINKIFKLDINYILNFLPGQWKNKLIITETNIYLNNEGLSLLNPFLVEIASLIGKKSSELCKLKINWPILTAHF